MDEKNTFYVTTPLINGVGYILFVGNLQECEEKSVSLAPMFHCDKLPISRIYRQDDINTKGVNNEKI